MEQKNENFIIKGKDWSKIAGGREDKNWRQLCSKNESPFWKNIKSAFPEGEPDNTNSLKMELDRYFSRDNGYGNGKLTPLNLGLYYNKELELYSSQYVGVMPLIDQEKQTVCSGEYLSIQSRFHLSPMEMLHEVMNGMDYYENPQMLSYKEYTVKELLDPDNFSEEKKVLFGVLKDAGKTSVPKSTSTDGVPNAGTNLMVGTEHSVFEVLRFVSQAKELCKKSLKKQSQPVEENLNGKVKGRILINKQIKYNLSKGQYHKTYCAYNSMIDNTLENRIIKYTLHLCSKFPIADTLNEDIMFCNRVLAKVPLQKCTSADFVGLKNNGAFKLYKEVLALAKIIHEKYFISYEQAGSTDEMQEKLCTQEDGLQIEPFFIDMNLLFEYYCRALFRKAIDKHNLEVGVEQTVYLEHCNQKKMLFEENTALKQSPKQYYMRNYIPDILVKYKSDKKKNPVFLVADAKYSNVGEQKWAKRERTHQILFYMNALQSNVGGLVGFETKEGCAVISDQYLVDGKQRGNKELFYLPVSRVTTEKGGSVSDEYVSAILSALKMWEKNNAKCEQEKKRYKEIERISQVMQSANDKDKKDLLKELLTLFDQENNSKKESK